MIFAKMSEVKKRPNLKRSGGMGAAAPKTMCGKDIPITAEQLSRTLRSIGFGMQNEVL